MEAPGPEMFLTIVLSFCFRIPSWMVAFFPVKDCFKLRWFQFKSVAMHLSWSPLLHEVSRNQTFQRINGCLWLPHWICRKWWILHLQWSCEGYVLPWVLQTVHLYLHTFNLHIHIHHILYIGTTQPCLNSYCQAFRVSLWSCLWCKGPSSRWRSGSVLEKDSRCLRGSEHYGGECELHSARPLQCRQRSHVFSIHPKFCTFWKTVWLCMTWEAVNLYE